MKLNTKIVDFFENIFFRIKGFYFNILYRYEDAYFKSKYLNLPSKIYYDRKFKTYVNPKIIDERGFLEYICSETVCDGVIYNYQIEGKDVHAHVISEVFIDAYNYAETFLIPKDCEYQYSIQELDFINKLVNQGNIDRKDLEDVVRKY